MIDPIAQNIVNNSLYFSYKKQQTFSTQKKNFMVKNLNLSVNHSQCKTINSKNKINASVTESEDSQLEHYSSQLLPTPKKSGFDFHRYNRLDEKILENSMQIKQNISLIQKVKNQLLQQQPQFPQIQNNSQSNIIRINLQSRTLKVKPTVRKQMSQEYIVNLKPLNQRYPKIEEGLSLNCLYYNQKSDASITRLLLINFENLLVFRKKTFWESKNESRIYYRHQTKQQEYCDCIYCPCQLRQDLRNILQILHKYYLIIFIFQNRKYAQVWNDYLKEQEYAYDGSFVLRSINQIDYIGFKINRLLQFYNKHKINRILYLDTFETLQNNQSIIKYEPDQFQYKIPLKYSEKQDLTIFFIQQGFTNIKNFDSKLIYDLCLAHYHKSISIVMKKQIIIHSLDLTRAFDYYKTKLHQNQFKKQLFKELKMITKQHRRTSYISDSAMKWVDQFRQELLDKYKQKIQDKVALIHYTIGDIIVRNYQYREQYLDNFDYLQEQAQLIEELKKVNQKMDIPLNHLENQCLINCYLCVEQIN